MEIPLTDFEESALKLDRAIMFAVTWHAGQFDKDGVSYILHPLRVMGSLYGSKWEVLAAAVLHDVVEDTDMTVEIIRSQFGDRVADLVDALSRREGETYKDYVKRAIVDPDARKIKKADVLDNLGRLPLALESMRPRYERTLVEILNRNTEEYSQYHKQFEWRHS